MRIGIFFDGFEFPPKTGAAFRFHSLVNILRKRGLRVVVFLCNRGWERKSILKKELGKVHLFSPRLFYQDTSFVQQVVASERLDVLQVEHAPAVLWFGAQYSQALHLPLITEMQDCDATLVRLFGESQRKVELMSFAHYVGGRFSSEVVCMTTNDYRELETLGIAARKLHVIPTGIDVGYFPYSKPNLQRRQIIFLGNMLYGPNADAVALMAEVVMPKVDGRLVCVGMATNAFKQKYKSAKTKFVGKVSDIRPILAQSSLAVAPLFSGSGIKVKMLNYGAAGLPIITTNTGISGYPQHLATIENDIQKYSARIHELLEHPKLALSQSQTARSIIEKSYSIDCMYRAMIGVYKKAKFHRVRTTFPKQSFRFQSYNQPPKIMFEGNSPLPLWLQDMKSPFNAPVRDYEKL